MIIIYHRGASPNVKIIPQGHPGTITIIRPSTGKPTPPPAYKWPRHNPNVPDLTLPDDYRETRIQDAPFILADHGIYNLPPPPMPLLTTGKIGQTVYQRTWNPNTIRYGNVTRILIRRRMVVPSDVRSDAQLLVRARFGRAVQLWKNLTPTEQHTYNHRGATRQPPIEGLNLWIREYARDHPLEEFQPLIAGLRANHAVPPPT